MKKLAAKVAKPAQFLFHKNLPPRDFSIMTLYTYVRTTPVKYSPYPPTKSGIVSYLLRYMYTNVICVYALCPTPCCRLIRIARYIWEFFLIKSIRISLQNWEQGPYCYVYQYAKQYHAYRIHRAQEYYT